MDLLFLLAILLLIHSRDLKVLLSSRGYVNSGTTINIIFYEELEGFSTGFGERVEDSDIGHGSM